jgi:hypothetical protein
MVYGGYIDVVKWGGHKVLVYIPSEVVAGDQQ